MQTGTGIVVEKKSSNNGKPMVNVDGKWYFAGRCDVSGINVGQRIEFGWTTFGSDPNRPMRGLENWAFTPNQPSPQEVEAAKAASAPKGKPFGKGGGFGGKDRATEIDLQCMRFVGQVVGTAIDAQLITNGDMLKSWAVQAWDAISFTRALGGTAPAPATPSSGQNATPAGQPQQSPQGGPRTEAGAPPNDPSQRVRPTGLFGYGKKYKDTPWNVLPVDALKFFLNGQYGQGSNAPADIKRRCDDELWFRAEEQKKAEAVQQQMADPQPDQWDADIPF